MCLRYLRRSQMKEKAGRIQERNLVQQLLFQPLRLVQEKGMGQPKHKDTRPLGEQLSPGRETESLFHFMMSTFRE